MIAPRTGELKELVDILNVGSPFSVDGSGAIISTFAINVPAKISPLGGNLDQETQQHQQFSQGYDIWIRIINGISAFQQIQWGFKRLVMTGPPEIFGRWLLIHTEERISRNL